MNGSTVETSVLETATVPTREVSVRSRPLHLDVPETSFRIGCLVRVPTVFEDVVQWFGFETVYQQQGFVVSQFIEGGHDGTERFSVDVTDIETFVDICWFDTHGT